MFPMSSANVFMEKKDITFWVGEEHLKKSCWKNNVSSHNFGLLGNCTLGISVEDVCGGWGTRCMESSWCIRLVVSR